MTRGFRCGQPTGDPDVTFDSVSQSLWYAKGLRFECTRCGNCCGGAAGTVRVTDQEVTVLARHLGLAEEAFRSTYTRRVHVEHLSLREKPNHECIFYDDTAGCTVYPARPLQCRTWPFWSAVVATPEAWQAESDHCPGMNQGPLHTCQHIRHTSADDGTFGTHVPPTNPRRQE